MYRISNELGPYNVVRPGFDRMVDEGSKTSHADF